MMALTIADAVPATISATPSLDGFYCHGQLAMGCQAGFRNHHGAHCVLVFPTSTTSLLQCLGASLLAYEKFHLILLLTYLGVSGFSF